MSRKLTRTRLGLLLVVASACATLLVPNAASAAPPANDAFADAVSVGATPFSAQVDVTESTLEAAEPVPCGVGTGSVWYRIDSVEARTVRINMSRAEPAVSVSVYRQTGSGLASLTALAGCVGQQQPVVVATNAGETLYVQLLRNDFLFRQSAQLDIDVLVAPPNDDFPGATTVSSLPFAETAETGAAGTEADEPPLCGPGADNTLWYAYTPTENQTLTARGFPEAIIAAYAGSSLTALTPVACQYFMPIAFAAEAGTTYHFQVGLPGQSHGQVRFTLDVAPAPSAAFSVFPPDPSAFDTITLSNASSDPLGSALSAAWDFGDGSTSTDYTASHRYRTDGDYTTTLTVTAPDGRTASTSQTIQVQTHDVQITKFNVPDKARAGKTETITIGVVNRRYPEQVEIALYKSVPGGDFVPVASSSQSVPVRGPNKTTDFRLNYTFTADDAAAGKVTFRAVATITTHRDAVPADNTALSFPVGVRS
jgi:PKD repeat protein